MKHRIALQFRVELFDIEPTIWRRRYGLGYESSFGGIGGCPFAPKATGNICCTEDLVYLLEEMGIDTGIDLRNLSAIACDVEVAVGHELPGQIMKAGLRLDLHSMDSARVAEG